ncbi:hypothetical protein RRG08_013363 [Elysia crispata]|uniref:Uncharacterized protein n=1 Tax=Elysia crispata TaxID=231223 RepID=A0AAE1AXR8_9GAST|nr:hypothetical protein RRG08_013363 [Elysia crispata]
MLGGGQSRSARVSRSGGRGLIPVSDRSSLLSPYTRAKLTHSDRPSRKQEHTSRRFFTVYLVGSLDEVCTCVTRVTFRERSASANESYTMPQTSRLNTRAWFPGTPTDVILNTVELFPTRPTTTAEYFEIPLVTYTYLCSYTDRDGLLRKIDELFHRQLRRYHIDQSWAS